MSGKLLIVSRCVMRTTNFFIDADILGGESSYNRPGSLAFASMHLYESWRELRYYKN